MTVLRFNINESLYISQIFSAISIYFSQKYSKTNTLNEVNIVIYNTVHTVQKRKYLQTSLTEKS